ncbi:hypothetical protein E8F20_05740 [Pseudomonas sp. BN415]|uniref:hypothetical protein n=1 Tax=Pseudomonas sp. BN415 TaxID=2567889 RepID=UPI002455152A|nr:hypothetical protein [Pseudomonas sp. BN415]MDH4581377.1 hypothetical protein [Pseudomonas sp. BN415]
MFKKQADAINQADKLHSEAVLSGTGEITARYELRKAIGDSTIGSDAEPYAQEIKDTLVPMNMESAVDKEGVQKLVDDLNSSDRKDQKDIHGVLILERGLGL